MCMFICVCLCVYILICYSDISYFLTLLYNYLMCIIFLLCIIGVFSSVFCRLHYLAMCFYILLCIVLNTVPRIVLFSTQTAVFIQCIWMCVYYPLYYRVSYVLLCDIHPVFQPVYFLVLWYNILCLLSFVLTCALTCTSFIVSSCAMFILPDPVLSVVFSCTLPPYIDHCRQLCIPILCTRFPILSCVLVFPSIFTIYCHICCLVLYCSICRPMPFPYSVFLILVFHWSPVCSLCIPMTYLSIFLLSSLSLSFYLSLSLSVCVWVSVSVCVCVLLCGPQRFEISAL